MSPNDVKLPVPALTSTATNPIACGGERHVARFAATPRPPATDAGTTEASNRHANPKDRTLGVSPATVVARASDAVPPRHAPPASTGTNPAPWIVTSVPPVAGPRVGSRPSTSTRGAA